MKKIKLIFISMLMIFFGASFLWSDQQVKIKVLAGQSTTDAGIEKLITEAVKAKYPEITLDWEIVGWGDLQGKMQQYIQSGLPDIIIGKAQDVATYGSRNLLADISEKPYLKNVLDAAVTSGSYKGKVYGLVYNALYQGVYYNRQVFSKYKLTIPKTQAELKVIVDKLSKTNVKPFETHFADVWSIGNMTMQFAINGVFNKTPDWGDKFRAGKVSFATSPEYKAAYGYMKFIYDNTWKNDTFSTEQTKADARFVQNKAAMKVSGSWSIQNFQDIDPNFDFGIFPFPNETGNSKLIFEPNITFMKSATTKYSEEIDKVFEVITSDKNLGQKVYNQTKTSSMLKAVGPTFKNPCQKDIDAYVAQGLIVDAGTGNNQLVWGGFQDQNAADIVTWLQGKSSLDQALKAADARKAVSKP